MNRSEVWWVNFDPLIGGEIRKRRPAVILSNNAPNKHLNRVQIVPLTSNTAKLYASETYVRVEGQQNKAMADQMTTVSKKRLSDQMGHLSREDMHSVERVVKIQLGLSSS